MWNPFKRSVETPLKLASNLLEERTDELMKCREEAQSIYKSSRGKPTPAELKVLRDIDARAWKAIQDCEDVVRRRLQPMAAGNPVELQGLISLAALIVQGTKEETRSETELRAQGGKAWSRSIENIEQRHHQMKGLVKALRNSE
jgi:hypothetical protein